MNILMKRFTAVFWLYEMETYSTSLNSNESFPSSERKFADAAISSVLKLMWRSPYQQTLVQQPSSPKRGRVYHC